MLPGISNALIIGNSVIAGSVSFDSPGTYNFTVPNYNKLRRRVWGAGGSGGATRTGTSYNGADGGSSSAGTVVSGGGQGGRIAAGTSFGAGGAGGTGMTVNGNPGGYGVPYGGGPGGSAPFGGAGSSGMSGHGQWSSNGGFPGGGSGGVNGYNTYYGPGGGGSGGYSDITVNAGDAGAPVPGTVMTVTVGTGGNPVSTGWEQSGWGGHGRVIIDWE